MCCHSFVLMYLYSVPKNQLFQTCFFGIFCFYICFQPRTIDFPVSIRFFLRSAAFCLIGCPIIDYTFVADILSN
ncbi:hypothetical protein BFAG_04901 [Bacteroides fragilis 3_1_12]|uniref:Transmembrane protein n=1 Tax=Bacteroides fragilis 3_1_12 TaxID=457424 RepID=A0ABN0BTC0_BACFG|nr:hypothetical protein BFAG_04901 [Bacteroides fragilis 3_1_12]